MGWNPNPQTVVLLNKAMEYINSVPYTVTGRWLFYRLYQDGFFQLSDELSEKELKDRKKKLYKDRFHPPLDRARKEFYNNWHPYILADETREIRKYGLGAMDESEITVDEAVILDKFKDQDYFVIICFEALAMCQQFEYYTESIPLCPFKGQASIPYKWEIAKLLEQAKEKYNKPIKVLYFGDCDLWGKRIPKSAFRDIKTWCDAEFDFEYVGLTEEQAEEYNIPDNPEKPGSYQWEALSDEIAKELITNAVAKYQNKDILQNTINREEDLKRRFRDAVDNARKD